MLTFVHFCHVQRKCYGILGFSLSHVRSLQLFAEPSSILYIRTHFDLQSVVIVSPDAGGAKR